MSRRRVRIKPKFYLLLTFIVGVAVAVLAIVMQDGAGGTLKSGAMEVEIEKKAVLIRDEMSVSVDKYDRVSFAVKEGETVYEGMPVAEVYKWGYTDDMAQSLLSVEAEIYNAQKSQLSGVDNAELSSIELQIEQKRAAIRACVSGGEGDALELQRELKGLMEQREAFLKSTVQPTEELTRLYNSKQDKQTQLSSYKTDISAARDGMVSFYFDGFEQVLNKDKLDTVNAALINATVSGTVDSLGGASNNLLYRLINPNKWYAAFVTDKSDAAALSEGENYTVTFDGYEEQPFSARAMELIHSDAGVMNMLEINENMGPLLNNRVITLKAKSAVSGIMLPSDAVGYKDGSSIVTIEGRDGAYDVRVDVVASDGEHSIVRAREGEGTLSEGMRYKKTMSVRENYEEIMANVQAAAEASGRKKEDITLIAVSKFVDEGRIKEAIACGAKNFGESRAQELTAKLTMFEQAGSNVHFIGQLQTNKVKYVIGNVKTIQSVDRLELANEISRLAQKKGIVQQVLIEVNIGGEPQKGGAYAEGLEEFLTNISRLNGVFVKGLMCIPPAVDEADARRYFAKMKMLFDRMAGLGLPNVAMDELSMGMSGDYRAAIAEGATMVRVGSAIFGERRRPGAEA